MNLTYWANPVTVPAKIQLTFSFNKEVNISSTLKIITPGNDMFIYYIESFHSTISSKISIKFYIYKLLWKQSSRWVHHISSDTTIALGMVKMTIALQWHEGLLFSFRSCWWVQIHILSTCITGFKRWSTFRSLWLQRGPLGGISGGRVLSVTRALSYLHRRGVWLSLFHWR